MSIYIELLSVVCTGIMIYLAIKIEIIIICCDEAMKPMTDIEIRDIYYTLTAYQWN